jgi:hypothetical protein
MKLYGNIWKHGNLDTHEEIWDVNFTGTRWVAVGSFGRVCRSTDGKNWSKQTVPGLHVKKDVLFGIAYDAVNDILVAVGRDELIISSEGDQGATWTIRNPRVPGTGDLYKVAFGNNMFLAISEKGDIWKSTDGANWAKSASLRVGSRHITFGNGWFMVTTVPGKIFRSQDGITWKKAHLGKSLIAVHYDGNSLWLAVGNKIWTSNNNGASWTTRLVLSKFGIYCHLYCVTSAPGTHIAAGEGGLLLTSHDGMEWRKHQQFTRRYIFGMAFGNSLLAAVGTGAPRNPQEFFKYSTHYSLEGGTPPSTLVPPSDNTIEIKSPRGGETLKGGSQVKIKWTGSITYDKIDIKYYKRSRYVVIKKGLEDNGVYKWTVPNVSTSKARIKIEGWHSSGNAVDYSDKTFEIIPNGSVKPVKITITAPKGREILTGGTTYNIKWQSSITFDKVDIEYYNGSKWVVIKNGTKDDGSYSWSVPNISTTKAKIWIKGWSPNRNPVDRSDDTFTISLPASITVTSPNGGEVLIKGSTENITWTSSGEVGKVNVSYSTDSGLNWTTIASSTANNGTLAWKVPDIIADNCLVKVSDVSNSRVSDISNNEFSIKEAFRDKLPFGEFATPGDGVTGVSGSIGVTGWALDDTCVESVKIYREVIGGLYYIGDAAFVEGTRPDVEQAYTDYPNSSRAGWGYMLLTNLFPDGKLVLKAIATDSTGNMAELGTKTIFVGNDNAVKPFGAIDTPDQGSEASGSKYRNSGWALTPMPNKIPEDGSTIDVYIDGEAVGKATYNLYRKDIATLFPGYANSDGACAYLDIDTTAYFNGVHTISWSVTDNAGNSAGIGSRYFTIKNTRNT